MPNLFEVTSPLGKRIRLTPKQWRHVSERHPEMRSQIAMLRECLATPDAVLYDPPDDNHQYYKWFDRTPVTGKYLLAVVRHLDGEGFVVTALFVGKGKIRTAGKRFEHGAEADLP